MSASKLLSCRERPEVDQSITVVAQFLYENGVTEELSCLTVSNEVVKLVVVIAVIWWKTNQPRRLNFGWFFFGFDTHSFLNIWTTVPSAKQAWIWKIMNNHIFLYEHHLHYGWPSLIFHIHVWLPKKNTRNLTMTSWLLRFVSWGKGK